jgi:parvulin-like peptidyl-prolyl isomerase
MRWCALLLIVGSAAMVLADEKTDKPVEKQDKDKKNPAPGGAGAVVHGVVVERVAAIVNDTIVLESEVAQRAAPMLNEAEAPPDPRLKQQQMRTVMRQATDQMIDEELILQAANEAKLEVSDEETTRALEEVKRQNKVTDEQFKQALSQQGYTISDYKRDVRKQILRLRAVNVLVRPRVQVSDADVKAHYEKMAGQSSNVTEVHFRHILIALPDKPSASEMDAARKKAGDLVSRAREGEDFAELVRANSEDAATKATGGDLGWFKRGGGLPTEWEEILFQMQPNEVRGPVRGPRGLHVFQVIDNKKEAVRPFNEVKEQLREQIFNEELEKQTKVWLEELHKRAHVEVKL